MAGRAVLDSIIEESGYKTGDPVIRGVRLRLHPGDSLLVVGESGSGKTTLLLSIIGALKNLLNGYTRGVSRVSGVDVLDPREFPRVAGKVGIVLQDPEKQIAMPTPFDEVSFTLENLGFGDEEVRERSMEYLRYFGLEAKAFAPVEELSGGEKRRVTLAASLAHSPDLL
ncbi:MAG: energy-coupling factor ABC transporter ATP-binding protein, partial [Desulfurococcales archaeon]|nr:energy-coupling factor ABC transporter ATP-binding protein [Desulfurococcales archaeon]